ncbi:hypothetical protein CPLU01_15951 [Colletotrichum plurivorum]|uniref:Uncharacterized protein n=1 Tax=Colletotrichum plurivorum TaxID=2175906 RepID=A0A8H6J3T2_9PEZI|nr:hypothetical protein CPLU01_15951 [Colletotrichum plurivorum]
MIRTGSRLITSSQLRHQGPSLLLSNSFLFPVRVPIYITMVALAAVNLTLLFSSHLSPDARIILQDDQQWNTAV